MLRKVFNKCLLLTLASFFIFNSFWNSDISGKLQTHPIGKESKIEKLILSQKNLKKLRSIGANVALDGVSKEYAKKLLNEISERYTLEFNILFNAVDFYNHKLPETWRTDLEMEKIRDSSRKRSDIYLLFSNKDWDNKNDSGDFSVVGEAHEDLGYAWIETHNKEEDIKNLAHEISHLFGLEHNNSESSFMHKKSEGGVYFTEDMRRKILENKFKTWEFSRYEPGKL